jgi:thiol-disulfide isomerase/thioredoxin
MSFSTIIAMMEEADKVKIFASSSWKKIETAQPKLAKDFKLYLDKDKFKDFIELANQVIEANQKNKTNAMFPKLDKDTWQNILKVVEYLRKEDPRLKSGAKLSNDVWWHEKVTREEVDAALDSIMEKIEELISDEVVAEGKNHLGETTYSSWGAWCAACKKIAPNVWYDGDKDIANAMVGPKPYVRNKTKSIGEWDGETGTVYKDAAETAASVVTEAALPIHAKLLNGDEVEMHKVDVYMNKKDGAILYLINGKTMSQYKATGKNLHADDVEML